MCYFFFLFFSFLDSEELKVLDQMNDQVIGALKCQETTIVMYSTYE